LTLAAGTRLGPYEITAKLGEGGMGEVYRATDTKLRRDVAIKVLPAAFVEDKERLARFEREAQLLAQLNHPNIAAIHGLEESGSVRALVMELVEGPTLAERLENGPLPLSESLLLARQIAEALEEAHEKGIIHRDLKPQNIKASIEGKVKVLDFGLAKAMDPTGTASGAPSASQLAASPTLTLGATVQGVILGTAAYMSPEQAKGFAVDKRADIWAFGVVLFEMLTGRSLFAGDSVPDTLARVLQREVDFDALPESTPPAIRRLLRRCLERKPKNRLHDIADARIVLDEVLAGASEEAVAALPGGVPKSGLAGWRLAVAALATLAAGALAAIVATGGLGRSGAATAEPPIRATIGVAEPLRLETYDRSVALSPDGTTLALSVRDPAVKNDRLCLRSLDRFEMKPLAGTEGATYPFWSPDGRALGFFADGKLKRVDLAGGIVRTLCEAAQGRGGTWSQRGVIVFAPGATGPLSQVSAEGGAPTPYTTVVREGEIHRLPHFLPDGRAIVFWAKNRGTPGEEAIYAFDPERGESKKIFDSETEARYVEPGYLAWVREENLIVQAFDVGRLALSGSPRPVAAGVAYDVNRHHLNLDLAAGGRLVYQESVSPPGGLLSWFDAEGHETPARDGPIPGCCWNARVSPDGHRAVVTTIGDHLGLRVQVFDLERGTQSPLGNSRQFSYDGAWSSDSEALALSAEIGGQIQLAWIRARAGEMPRALTTGLGMEQRLGDFTPDGRSILFEQHSNVDKRGDLFLVDIDGKSPPRPFVTGPANETTPRISPDGRWVAYVSDASGRDAIWVTDFPDAKGRWQVSSEFFGVYGWMGNDELYWEDSDDKDGVVTIRARGNDLDVGPRRMLFGGRAMHGLYVADYSSARKRFLVSRPNGPSPTPRLVVVSDWRAALGAGGAKP